MRTSSKLGLTALMVALLLSAAVNASARNLDASAQNFRATWFELEILETGGFSSAFCPVTLEGSFHRRTITKTARTLIGAITKVDVKTESCTGSRSVRIRPTTLPWHVTYEAFTGTLPNITSVQVLLSRFLFEYFEAIRVCNFGTATDNITFSAALNAERSISELRPIAGRNIVNLLAGPAGCELRVFLRSEPGDGIVAVLNTTTRIRVTLI